MPWIDSSYPGKCVNPGCESEHSEGDRILLLGKGVVLCVDCGEKHLTSGQEKNTTSWIEDKLLREIASMVIKFTGANHTEQATAEELKIRQRSFDAMKKTARRLIKVREARA